MANGQFIGEILDLWRSAIAFCYIREPTRTSAQHAPDQPGMWPEEIAYRPPDYAARSDQLTSGMKALGIDVDEFHARYSLRHHEMEQSCAACCARSRCRRDLATGDFTRRYHHYCPNAATLTQLAASIPIKFDIMTSCGNMIMSKNKRHHAKE